MFFSCAGGSFWVFMFVFRATTRRSFTWIFFGLLRAPWLTILRTKDAGSYVIFCFDSGRVSRPINRFVFGVVGGVRLQLCVFFNV